MRPLKIAGPLACLVLCLAAPLNAQEATRSHLSSDPQVNEARALVEGKDFIEALSILRPLAPDHPDQVDVLFLVGLAALGAAQLPEMPEAERRDYLDEAVAAFHRILVERPELVRVRLELALAFYLKREDGLARQHFERVLAGDPAPAIAANVRRFLAAMRERRRWNGYFGATLAPDSNINASSSSDGATIHIQTPFSNDPLPFSYRKGEEEERRSGVGVVLWGGGEYERPLSTRVRLRVGGRVSRTEYEGQEFDQMFLSAHGGPRWSVGRRTEISLLGSARRRWIGGEPHSREVGARFEMGRFVGRRAWLGARASYHQREHDLERNVYLDGPRSDFSLTGVWQATPTVRFNATVGLTREETKLERFRNTGRSLGLGTSVDLPRGFTVGLNGQLLWTGYEGEARSGSVLLTPPGESRRDRTTVLRLSLLNRAFTVLGFSPKLVLVRESRHSNAQLQDYRRTRTELEFVRQF